MTNPQLIKDCHRELRDGHRIIDGKAAPMIVNHDGHCIAQRSDAAILIRLLNQLRRAYSAGHVAAQVEAISDLNQYPEAQGFEQA